MRHIRKFEKYTIERKKSDLIKESVLHVNDTYKVRTFVDIPQSLINSYVKKVKDSAGKNLRQFFGDVDIAEEIVKYINLNFLNVDKLPADALMGGNGESTSTTTTDTATTETSTDDTDTTTEPKEETTSTAETESQPEEVKVETETTPQSTDFEEVKAEESEEKTEKEESESTEEKPEEKEELPS